MSNKKSNNPVTPTEGSQAAAPAPKVVRTKVLVIHDWMLDIPLTDKQQKLYALIYGYSQDGSSRMRGTASGIAEWLGCTTRNAQILTRQLESMGLISHEVVYDRRRGCNVTEFWAVLGEDLALGEKTKINWSGKGRPVYETDFVNQHETDFVNVCETDFVNHVDSNNINIYTRSSRKNTAHARVDDDNDDVLKLFEDESGLAPGGRLRMPFQEDVFVKAWRRLLEVPAWAKKSVPALQLVLDELGEKCDLSEAVFCVNMAVRKEWTDITPSEILARENPDNIPHYQTDAERVEFLGRMASNGTITLVQSAELEVLNKKLGRAK